VSLFVWALPFDLSGMGGPTSSYATAGIALRVTESHKPPHHYKVETPSGETISVHCTIKMPCLKRSVACFLTRLYEFHLSAIHVEFAVDTAALKRVLLWVLRFHRQSSFKQRSAFAVVHMYLPSTLYITYIVTPS